MIKGMKLKMEEANSRGRQSSQGKRTRREAEPYTLEDECAPAALVT